MNWRLSLKRWKHRINIHTSNENVTSTPTRSSACQRTRTASGPGDYATIYSRNQQPSSHNSNSHISRATSHSPSKAYNLSCSLSLHVLLNVFGYSRDAETLVSLPLIPPTNRSSELSLEVGMALCCFALGSCSPRGDLCVEIKNKLTIIIHVGNSRD